MDIPNFNYFDSLITNHNIIGLISCALTGLCTSMLWAGNLVISSEKFPQGGVMLYTLMAAGGDVGASVVPQLIGMIRFIYYAGTTGDEVWYICCGFVSIGICNIV